MLEALKQGNNEAEWIVDLTTQADRQGRCWTPACILASDRCASSPVQMLSWYMQEGPWCCCV